MNKKINIEKIEGIFSVLLVLIFLGLIYFRWNTPGLVFPSGILVRIGGIILFVFILQKFINFLIKEFFKKKLRNLIAWDIALLMISVGIFELIFLNTDYFANFILFPIVYVSPLVFIKKHLKRIIEKKEKSKIQNTPFFRECVYYIYSFVVLNLIFFIFLYIMIE